MNKFLASVLPKQKNRIEGLDLMRSIAIICVVLYHAWLLLSSYFPSFGLLFFLGFWGVELFFVLSGFLVGGIFIRSYLAADKINIAFLFNFWKRRWKRTIPIYLIVLVFSYFLLNNIFRLEFGFPYRHFLFIQNLWYVHPGFFPEAWSLAVEEWFYITLPFSFIILSYIHTKKHPKSVLISILIAIVFYTSLRMLNITKPFDMVSWDNNIRKIVLYRLDAIMYGVLCYQVINMNEQFFRTKKLLLFFIGAFGLVLSYYFFYQKIHVIYSSIFFLSATSLSISFCFPFFYYFKFKWESLKNIVTLISVSSYSMYLIHYTIVFRIFNTYFNSQNLQQGVLVFLAYLITVFCLSLFVYRFVEKPVSGN